MTRPLKFTVNEERTKMDNFEKRRDLKTPHKIFSVHTSPHKFENARILVQNGYNRLQGRFPKSSVFHANTFSVNLALSNQFRTLKSVLEKLRLRWTIYPDKSVAMPKQTTPFHERPSLWLLRFPGSRKTRSRRKATVTRSLQQLTPHRSLSGLSQGRFVTFSLSKSTCTAIPSGGGLAFNIHSDRRKVWIPLENHSRHGWPFCAHAFLLVQTCRVALDPEVKFNVRCLFWNFTCVVFSFLASS